MSTGKIVRWPGGKGPLLPRLRPSVPANFKRIVSPFAGGLALELDLLGQRRELRAVLADRNAELIATYTAVRDDVESVIAELRKHDWSEAGYRRVRDMGLTHVATLPPAERAARFLYLNRCAFNGLQRENASGQNNVAFGGFDPRKLPAWERRIRAASAVLARVELMTGDFEATLAQVEPGDFVFADPPYDGTFTGYTGEGFGPDDQARLARALLELSRRGVRVMTTNADTERVRELYSGPEWRIHELPIRRNIAADGAARRAVTELCFTSYDAKHQPENMTGATPVAPAAPVQTEARTLQRSRRTGDAEVRTRVEFVQELVRAGMDRAGVVKAFRQRFGGSVRTADGYLRRAREAFAIEAVTPEALGAKREAERQDFLAKLDQDIAECKRAGVWNALVGLRRLQADVSGLRVLRQAEPPAAAAPSVNVAIVNGAAPDATRAHRIELLSRLIERNPEMRDLVLERLGSAPVVVAGESHGHVPGSSRDVGSGHVPDTRNVHVSGIE